MSIHTVPLWQNGIAKSMALILPFNDGKSTMKLSFHDTGDQINGGQYAWNVSC